MLWQLPRESRFMQAFLGERARWGDQEHLMASVVDVLTMLNHNLIQSNSRKKLRPPKPMKRPGVDEAPNPNERKLTGKAVPLARLKQLAERWRGIDPEGMDDGGS